MHATEADICSLLYFVFRTPNYNYYSNQELVHTSVEVLHTSVEEN